MESREVDTGESEGWVVKRCSAFSLELCRHIHTISELEGSL